MKDGRVARRLRAVIGGRSRTRLPLSVAAAPRASQAGQAPIARAPAEDPGGHGSTMSLEAAAALCSGITGLAAMCQGITLSFLSRRELEDHNADREAVLTAKRLYNISKGLAALVDEPRRDELVTRELERCRELVDELQEGLTRGLARRTERRPLQDPLRARDGDS